MLSSLSVSRWLELSDTSDCTVFLDVSGCPSILELVFGCSELIFELFGSVSMFSVCVSTFCSTDTEVTRKC